MCLYRVINVYLYFHTIYTRENLTLKLKLYTSLVPPLSSIPPSFALPPPFVFEAAILFCSNERTSKAAGMEDRGQGAEISKHFDNYTRVIEPGL